MTSEHGTSAEQRICSRCRRPEHGSSACYAAYSNTAGVPTPELEARPGGWYKAGHDDAEAALKPEIEALEEERDRLREALEAVRAKASQHGGGSTTVMLGGYSVIREIADRALAETSERDGS